VHAIAMPNIAMNCTASAASGPEPRVEQTALLVSLVQQNNEPTEVTKRLTERIDTLSLEVHKKLECPPTE
jgi:hypothetical protein